MLLQNWKFYDTNVTKEAKLLKARYASSKRSLKIQIGRRLTKHHESVKEARIKLQRYEFYHV